LVEHFELIVLGLLVSVAGLVLLSYTLNVPYPIFLVLGALILGFVPSIPRLELEQELVLLIFLPPLLYSVAFFSSLRELQANLRPIGLLSVGLVVLILMGLQLPAILENPRGRLVTMLALDAALVCLAVIVIRCAWAFLVAYSPVSLADACTIRIPLLPGRTPR
jgi:NhaP-type Na+/H+ or K+/H+ antiporter